MSPFLYGYRKVPESFPWDSCYTRCKNWVIADLAGNAPAGRFDPASGGFPFVKPLDGLRFLQVKEA